MKKGLVYMFFRELETERLFLKNISTDDREFIFAHFSNEEVNKYLYDAEPMTKIQDADEIISFYLQPKQREHHRWVLVRKSDGVKMGTCGFHCRNKLSCDVGYDLHPDFQGNGYMYEAMKAILDFAQTDMRIKYVNACIYIDNQKSIKLTKKLGFVFEGKMKDEIFRGEEYPHKVLSYKCTRMIKTERLVIRRFSPNDWRDLFEYLSQESVVKFEPYEIFSEEKSKAEAVKRSRDENFWAVCLKETEKLIGNIYLSKQEFYTWMLGYVFNSEYQGKGYATEAARAMLNELFLNYKARRVTAMCNPLNQPSWKLLERLGFRREGHLRQNIFFKKDEDGFPIWSDTYEYGILRTEWIKQN
jgi:RimJ/RimL family protein N-acetyltransferase